MTPAALVPEFGVTDATASLHFYTNILGFRVEYARASQNFHYLSLGSAQIMIEQLSSQSWLAEVATPPLGRGMHLQIMIDDLDPLLERLKAGDITLFREPEDTWYKTSTGFSGQRQCVVADPDGYLLRFAQSLGERPEAPPMGRVVDI